MGGSGYHTLYENRVFLEFLTIKLFPSKLTSGWRASWKVTAEAGRREEQVLEGPWEGSQQREEVCHGLAFWAAVSHFLPVAELSAFSRGLNLSFLRSYTWGRSESSPAVHYDLGDGPVSKVMAVKHEDLCSDFRHTRKKSGVAAGACSPSTEDTERKIPGTH